MRKEKMQQLFRTKLENFGVSAFILNKDNAGIKR